MRREDAALMALEQRLQAIYDEHGIPHNGRTLDERECTAPCCYAHAEDDRVAAQAIKAVLADTYVGVGVGSIPGIDYLILRYWRKHCAHVWRLVGPASMTSAGTMDRYKCAECGAGDYRPVRPV